MQQAQLEPLVQLDLPVQREQQDPQEPQVLQELPEPLAQRVQPVPLEQLAQQELLV